MPPCFWTCPYQTSHSTYQETAENNKRLRLEEDHSWWCNKMNRNYQTPHPLILKSDFWPSWRQWLIRNTIRNCFFLFKDEGQSSSKSNDLYWNVMYLPDAYSHNSIKSHVENLVSYVLIIWHGKVILIYTIECVCQPSGRLG